MKVLGQNGLARLISKTKTALDGKINTTDIVTASTLDIDNVPTDNSNNLVKSGGVKSALDAKQNIINSSSKLSADLVSDGSTNKVVTQTEKNTWNNKSTVSASTTGTSTTEAKYLTVNGTEYKIPDTTIGTLKTDNTTAQATSSGESFSNTINLHQVAKTGNADKVDGFMLNDQAMAYIADLSIKIGVGQGCLSGTMTEAEIFALTGYRYGEYYYASDTNKIYRRSNTATTASASYWRDDTSYYNASLLLPNQLQDEQYIYVKINTNEPYYNKLTKFFIGALYDNTNGTTTVTGHCRTLNKFYIHSCAYNGNNILGIYQKSANTDVFYIKLKRYAGTYGFEKDYFVNINVLTNFQKNTATIEFIGKDHAEYATVNAYNFIAVPAYGINSNAMTYINGTPVPDNPKFTDTTYVSKAPSQGGTDTSLVTTGDKYKWDNKQNALTAQTAYSAKGTATKVPQITTNALGQVTDITEVTITQPDISGKLDKYTTSGVHTVYANNNGTQTNLNYGTTATSNYVVQRQNNGQITVPSTPSADTDAASKQFVNSSIATNTANFLGTLDASGDLELPKPASHEAIVAALNNWSFSSKTNNDYCFVINKDEDEDVIYDRFKYSAAGATFSYEYSLNNSSFTQAQWNSINSGIDSTKVSSYDTHISSTSNPHGVTKTQVGLGNVENKSSATIRSELTNENVTTALGFTPLSSSTGVTSVNGYSGAISGMATQTWVNNQIANKTNTSVLPNDNGNIKTKFRIAKSSYTGGSTLWYYPIAKLPKDDAGNCASCILSGRIGGWVSSNMSSITSLIWNRDGTGIALLDIAGTSSSMNNIWNLCDIVVYTNDDATDTIYLKCSSYFTFDIDIELFQNTATIIYDGNYLKDSDNNPIVPSGTLNAQASTSTKRLELVNGKLLLNGTQLSTFSGSYNDLTNKPTIPTIPSNIAYTNQENNFTSAQYIKTNGNGIIKLYCLPHSNKDYGVITLTDSTRPLIINKDGGNVNIGGTTLQPTYKLNVDGTFNATDTIYQNGVAVALISQIPTVPTNISSFNNDSGYITGITSGMVINALGYTPYNSTNPNGYITSSALNSYLPLTAGSSKPLTGDLYFNNSNGPHISYNSTDNSIEFKF